MLGWIEKVVPQPPVITPAPVVVEKDAKPETKTKETKSEQTQQPLEGTSSHPAGGSEKKESVVTPDPASTTESSGQGVLTWLSQGLGKVVPHPLQNAVIQPDGKTSDACNQTETLKVEDKDKRETTDISGKEGEIQPSSDNNAAEKTDKKKVFTRMMEEFEKIIPQPENVKKEAAPEDQGNTKGSNKEVPQKENSPVKPLSMHRSSVDNLSTSLFPQTLGGDGTSIFKRIRQGLEKAIPHPVSKEKPDGQTVEAGGPDPGQERSKGA